MKKSILVVCAVLTTLSVMAVGYMNMNDSEELNIIYNVDSRFMATISKEDLHKATSVLDIVPKKATGWWKVDFQSVMVAVLQNDDEIRAMGEEKLLNAEQSKLLQTLDYSSNFYIKARGKDIHPETGRIENYVYYFTVIPEKEAEYSGGYDALIDYLKENSKEYTTIIEQDKLQPGQVSFSVTKDGTIDNVKLISSCGYPSVDEVLVEMITNMPKKWTPATNSQGEKVEQELVFFFGLQGC